MANKKISQLSEAGNVGAGDFFPVATSAGGGNFSTKKCETETLATYVLSPVPSAISQIGFTGTNNIYFDKSKWVDTSAAGGNTHAYLMVNKTDGQLTTGSGIGNPVGGDNMGNCVATTTLNMQDNNIGNVDIASSLPAGSNAIGKLAANSGVDIGDVDVTSLPASTNTIEVVGDAAEDAAVAGNPLLSGGRYDSSERTLDNGDVGALALDPTGAVYVREYLGQSGSILVTGTTAVTTSVSGTKFVAIQFIEDTVFASSGGLVATTEQLWPDDTGASTNIDGDGGSPIDSVTFPQGMTIFGRWDGFTLASGKCIGYLGKV